MQIAVLSTAVLYAEDASYADAVLEESVADDDYSECGIDVHWDDVRVGEITAQLGSDGELCLICYADLIDLLGDRLADDVKDCLCEFQDADGRVAVDCLERYDPRYDCDCFLLRLVSPPYERDAAFVDLNPRPDDDYTSGLLPEEMSGYINTSHVFRARGSDDRHYFLLMDGALSLYQWVAEVNADLDPERDRPWHYHDLRIIHDFCDPMTRLTVGEIQSFGPRILKSDRIQGIQYSTNPIIRRNRATYPLSEYSFFLERDARVEVWVNDVQKHVLQLRAGPQDVRNFPLATGFNRVRLKIVDDIGNIEYRDFDSVYSSELLPYGVTDYTFSGGVEGQGDEFSDDWVVAGSVRSGVSQSITALAEGRVDQDYQSATLGGSFCHRLLNGSVYGSVTHSPDGTGGGLDIIVERPCRWVLLAGRVSLRDQRFLVQDDRLSSRRLRSSFQAVATSSLPEGWGYVRATAFRENRWQGAPSTQNQVQWVLSFSRSWDLKTGIEYSKFNNPRLNYNVILAYTYRHQYITRRHSVESSHERILIRNNLGGSHFSNRLLWTAEHQHHSETDGKTQDNVTAWSRYYGERCDLSYTSYWDDITENDDALHIGRLEYSLAYAGGQWAIGPPIRNCFALVCRDHGLREANFYVQGGGKNKELNGQMPVVLTNLQPYRLQRVRVDPGDGVELDPQDFSLGCRYRSGSVIKVGFAEGEHGHFALQGVLLNLKGDALKLRGITFQRRNSKAEEPAYSFTDEKGYFYVIGLAPDSDYTVDVVGEPDLHYRVDTKAQSVKDADVGTLKPILEREDDTIDGEHS